MENLYEVKNLKFRYSKKSKNIIEGTNFEIKKGEILGFLGVSGVGKTTVQKILIKTLKQFKGEVIYKEKKLNDYDSSFFEDIGVSFEFPIYFQKLSGWENIKFYASLYKKTTDIEKLFKKLSLWEHRNKRVSDYSKGMKMRLNFIRALINDPEILFLDEPTNGLDPATSLVMKNMILSLKKEGKTIFLTTHLMNDVEYLCDRVAFIVDGKIKLIKTVKELKLEYSQDKIIVQYKNKFGLVKDKKFKLKDIKSKEFINFITTSDIITIHSLEMTLDEIFISVTGVKTGTEGIRKKNISKELKNG